MNREIKFRGKSIMNNTCGDWLYSSGIKYGDDIELMYCDEDTSEEWNYIDKETLGQYTGLHDKNGKGIYEGDIVTGSDYPFIDEGKQNYIGIVVFYDDVAQFGYEYKCIRKDRRGISNGINNEFEANENLVCEDLEVIGNIYDNPGLLGGE